VSVNVTLHLRVQALPTAGAAADVIAVLRKLFTEEGVADDVELVVAPGPAVVSHTPYPLIISRFYKWRDPFEDAIRSAVAAVAPHAVVTIDWGYPDDV
jgi:hypothetical protein